MPDDYDALLASGLITEAEAKRFRGQLPAADADLPPTAPGSLDVFGDLGNPADALGEIPQQYVTGPKGTTPTDVRKAQADVGQRATDFTFRERGADDLHGDVVQRGRGMAEGIIATEAPPDPNMSAYEGMQRAIMGDAYPVLDKLPMSERVGAAIEMGTPMLARAGVEALRTGDLGAAGETFIDDLKTFEPLAHPVDVAMHPLDTLGELATRPMRIGDDVITVESPTMRLLRVVGGGVQAGITATAHEALKHTTPRDLMGYAQGIVAQQAGLGALVPTIAATGLSSPADMVMQDRDQVRAAVDLLYTATDAVEGTLRKSGLHPGVADVTGTTGRGTAALAGTLATPDQPFITDVGERAERGEDRWAVTSLAGERPWIPESIGSPLAIYMQEVSRGRGGREIGAEIALSQGYDKASPEYTALSVGGLLTDFIPYDGIPGAALGKLYEAGKAARAGHILGAAAGADNYAALLEGALQEFARRGGSVDAAKPAVGAFRKAMADGRAVEAWQQLATVPELAKVADRIHFQKTGRTIAEELGARHPLPPGSAVPPAVGETLNRTGEGNPPPVPPAPAAPAAANPYEAALDGEVPVEPVPVQAPNRYEQALDEVQRTWTMPTMEQVKRAVLEADTKGGDALRKAVEPYEKALWSAEQRVDTKIAERGAPPTEDPSTMRGAAKEYTPAPKVDDDPTQPGAVGMVAEVRWAPTTDHPIDGPMYRAAALGDELRRGTPVDVEWEPSTIGEKQGTPVAVEWEPTTAGDIDLPDPVSEPDAGVSWVGMMKDAAAAVNPRDVLSRLQLDEMTKGWAAAVRPAAAIEPQGMSGVAHRRGGTRGPTRARADAGDEAREAYAMELQNNPREIDFIDEEGPPTAIGNEPPTVVPIYAQGGRPREEKGVRRDEIPEIAPLRKDKQGRPILSEVGPEPGDGYQAGGGKGFRAGARLPMGPLLMDRLLRGLDVTPLKSAAERAEAAKPRVLKEEFDKVKAERDALIREAPERVVEDVHEVVEELAPPRYAPEDEAKMESFLRHPAALMSVEGDANASTSWAAAMRYNSQRCGSLDTARAMRMMADVVDPGTSTAARITAAHSLALWQGPAVHMPGIEVADAVREGRITEADAAKAIQHANTAGGQQVAAAVEPLRGAIAEGESPLGSSVTRRQAGDKVDEITSATVATFLNDEAAMKQRLAAAEAFLAQAPSRRIREDMVNELPIAERVAFEWDRLRKKARQKHAGRSVAGESWQTTRDRLLDEAARDLFAEPKAQADLNAGIAAELPPPRPGKPSVGAALGFHPSNKPGAGSLPKSPREAVLDTLGSGVAEAPWDEARARKGTFGQHSGAYDARSMLLEDKPHVDGVKYKVIQQDGTRLGRTLYTQLDALKQVSKKLVPGGTQRQVGAKIIVHESGRPIAEWKYDPRSKKVRLMPHYGASPEEAALVRDLDAGFSNSEMELWRREQAAAKERAIEQADAAKRAIVDKRDVNYSGGPPLGEVYDDLFKHPDAVDLPPELDGIADSVEQAMRSYIRASMGSDYLVPFVGGTLVTPLERTRILAGMRNELRPLYDMDAYYTAGGGLKLDEFGQVVLNESQRRDFWALNAKYGGTPADSLTAPVTPAMTRELHNRMARKLAGQGAWMENTIGSMAAWSRLALGVLKSSSHIPGATSLFDIEGTKMRLRAPEAAAVLDRAVHTLTANSSDVTRIVHEVREADTSLGNTEALRHVLENGLGPDVWRPLSKDANDLVDLAMRPGIATNEAAEIGRRMLAQDGAIVDADLLAAFDAEVKRSQRLGWGEGPVVVQDAHAKVAKEWTKRRLRDRRHIARMWLESVLPGKAAEDYRSVLRSLNPDEDLALDRLYHDAFVRPDPGAWGRVDGGVLSEWKEWFNGGGKLQYLRDERGLGAAIKARYPKMKPPAEDEALLNFVMRLRSERIKATVIRDVVRHELGVAPGRTANLVVDILLNPEAGTLGDAAQRGYVPSDVIEAHRVIDRMGLAPGEGRTLTAIDDVLVAPYVAQKLDEAAAAGITDPSSVNVGASMQKVIYWWKQNALGRMSILTTPARPIADTMGAFLQAYLTRGGIAVSDVVGTVSDPGAWAIAGDLSDLRSRKFSAPGTKRATTSARKNNVYVFPTGVFTHDELVDAFRQRGVDAQAARSENAAQLIDDLRRHDHTTFRKFVAVDDHVRLANEVSNFLDMQFRTRVALGELKRGATLDEACLASREALYDYSGMTKFERQTMRKWLPWYTFTKRNGEAVLKALLTNPSRVAYLTRLMYRQPDVWGFSDEQQAAMTPTQWSSFIVGADAPRNLDYDGRFYAFNGINPADALLWVQAQMEGPEAWAEDLYPWTQYAIDAAAETKGAVSDAAWRDRLNEVPGWWMEDRFMSGFLRSAFGVDAVHYPKGDKGITRATLYDEQGLPQRWVAGQVYEKRGDFGRALAARVAWRAFISMAGKSPERAREYLSIMDPSRRPPEQSVGGMLTEATLGVSTFERPSTEAAIERERRAYIDRIKSDADTMMGPATPQGPGVGIYNEAGPE
jgi:hypothetical protein